jgi:thiol:disulfide interchange protein DsbC
VKKLTAVALFILFLFPAYVFAKNESASAKNAPELATKSAPAPAKNEPAPAAKNVPGPVAEQFKKSFPKNNFESITPTEAKGVYEVYTGNQIYYYIPKDDVIIIGPMISKNGINITKESYNKKTAQKMANLSLESALKIGNGKITVVEFIDLNCHFCRESYKYFAQRKDVTIYAFFFPLSKESADKTKYILCAKDAVKAYEDALSGKLDNTQLTACTDKKVDETVKMHMKMASQIGVKATPLFYIKGQVVEGFDPPAIEKLLKD